MEQEDVVLNRPDWYMFFRGRQRLVDEIAQVFSGNWAALVVGRGRKHHPVKIDYLCHCRNKDISKAPF